MQFIANGPNIPDELLQAHEEGRVVFFCGAGISYPADLPDFKGLVERIYQLNGAALSESDIESDAFTQDQFDATLDLLERRLPGQRLAVRRALAQVLLKPKLRRKGAIDTQAALLRLGRNREGALRLVTTNFDRIFHVAAKRTGQAFQAHAAPMLPIPKKTRWNGLVYLHGLLPGKMDDTALNRLVVTSGDFGLAYFTERWAARFVSELFRNYVVCFVGYSIKDPVLRYMMDALAADRMLGEVTPQAWAFGSYDDGKEHIETIKWQAKGVAPVLYSNTNNHSALHQTLHAWSETYRDGVQGKEAIVVKHAMTSPQESTQQDDFVGRMLWALSDKSGLPAKRFADFNPAPSLDWLLEPFAHEHFRYSDLSRFGVPPRDEVDTYVALGPTEGYTIKELQSAIGALPSEGLEESAQALSQAVEGAGEQCEDYWKNRAYPFWQKIWPKSRELATPRITESLSRLVIAARDEFPSALEAVFDWLKPLEHPDYAVHLLYESGLCKKYPTDALRFLSAMIDNQPWRPRELSKCLTQIVQVEPLLEQKPSYLRLREYDRRHGG
jgi:hypothetical protein